MQRIVASLSFLIILRYSFADKNIDFRFTSNYYNVTIPENSVGKTYTTPEPGYEKIGIFLPEGHSLTDLRFKIISGDRDKFFKAEENLIGDFCFLFIRTRTGNTAVLNRERKDRYDLEVRATANRKDGKHKYVLEADTNIRVTILDTNDLNPLFYPTEYQVLVPEDTPIHQSIIQVFAEDADLGRNGEIYYSFLDETDQFAINPISGIISLTRPLKFTDGSYHELVVLGQDRGFNSRSITPSKARVKIRVKQVNLYSPEIRIHRLPHIVENSNADIYAIVNVSDKDVGIHGEIKNLEIVDGDPDGHFRIRPTQQKGEFTIEVLKLLDREATPQGYQLKLRATDQGIPPRESYKSVPVQLTDLNDNSPVFNKEIYEVKVSETVPVNTPLIRLKVTDKDDGKNAQVYLEIVGGNEGNEFHINPDTGVLYTAVKLDYEQKNFYSLTVSAIDQGNTGTRKQSSAKVKINVVDANDNDPTFEKSDITIWINENEPSGTSVTKVTAKDRDAGENAYISYSIVNLKPVPFEIDPFSGLVKTTQLIDYESMRREYVLRLRASDWGLPYRRQTEMQLTIKIKDQNDNRPQFEKIDCTGHVPRYVPIGSEIITLSAIDFDAGNIISYRIVSGNDDNCFTLDATSGTLSVSCDLNELKTNERVINITATDGTHFADTVSVNFQLVNSKRNSVRTGRILTDELGAFDCKDTGVARRLTEVLASAERNNDEKHTREDFLMMPTRYGQNVHSPEFLDFPIEIKVNESVDLGTTLVKIKARDRDLGYNGKLIFGISGGDDDSVFCLDTDSGELKIIGYLDRERENEYLLNITVYDLGKPQKSASKILPITVLDVNDNSPKFEKSLASFRVTENALNGTAIFRANATDLDSGDNAKITYSLQTDTHDFMVDPYSGVLFVCNTLDRERQDLYELRIRATDNGGRSSDTISLHSEALVRISIDDINDNSPTFALQHYSVKVREDIPVGTVVATITAIDPDIGPEGDVVYSMVDEDGTGAFKVDRLSGTIRVAKPLDFESLQLHTLVLTARDQGTPSLAAQCRVTVGVVDVDENQHAPQFPSGAVRGALSESAAPGATALRLSAPDGDAPGDDARVGFALAGGDGVGVFEVDQQDFESLQLHTLVLTARDQGTPSLAAQCRVTVGVVDVDENQHAPQFPSGAVRGALSESAAPGATALRLSASDGDAPGDDARVGYALAGGDGVGVFEVDQQAQCRVTVGVVDVDENQHAPQFPSGAVRGALSESAAPGATALRLSAPDGDAPGDDARVGFALAGGDGVGVFEVDQQEMDPEFVKADSRNLPCINAIMLHLFYKENPNFVSAEIRNVKTQRATREVYGDEAIGYVQVQRKNKICTIKGKVTPEHRVHDKAYDVMVEVDEDDQNIISCQCYGCAASLGGCKHSVAFLFWLYRRGLEPASTSVECYWRASSLSRVKNIKSMSLKDMFKRDPLPCRNDTFLNKIVDYGRETCSQSLLNKHFIEEDAVEKTSIHNLIVKYCNIKEMVGEAATADDFLIFCQENMIESDCLIVTRKTETQSKTSKWYEARYCRITASRLYEAAKCKTKDGVLIEKLFGASKIPQTDAMVRGLSLEDAVLAEIRKKRNITVKKCGMLLRCDYPIFGASPDAVSDKYCIEIKCPSKEKTVSTYISTEGKIANKFLAQIQLQMLMAKKTHGLFCVASPNFEEDRKVKIIEIEFDNELCQQLMEQATTFWNSAVFPKLIYNDK